VSSTQKTTDISQVIEEPEEGEGPSSPPPAALQPEINARHGNGNSNTEPVTISSKAIHPGLSSQPRCRAQPLFAIEQLGVDRRLLVNRKRQLKMYRVWMQGKFRKLAEERSLITA